MDWPGWFSFLQPSRWHGGTEPPSADQQHDAFASSAAGRPASPAQGITDMAASPSGSTCAVPSEITSEIGASDSHTPLENMGPGRPKSHKKVVNPSPEKSKVVDTSSELAEKTGEEEDLVDCPKSGTAGSNYDDQEGDDSANEGLPQRPQQNDVVDLLDNSSSNEESDGPSERERQEEGPGGVAAEVDGGYYSAEEGGGNAGYVPIPRKAAASAKSPSARASQHAVEDSNGVYSSENNADDEHTLKETEESEASHVEAPFDEKEEDDPDLEGQAAGSAVPAAGSPPPDHERADHQQKNVLLAAAMSSRRQSFKEDDRALSQAQQPPASAFPAQRSPESSDEDAFAAATAGGTAVGEDGDGFCRAKLSPEAIGLAIASTLVSPEDLTDDELQGNGNFNSKAETVLNRVARDRELQLSRQQVPPQANLSDSKEKKDSRPSSEDEGEDSEQSLKKHCRKTNAVVENIKTDLSSDQRSKTLKQKATVRKRKRACHLGCILARVPTDVSESTKLSEESSVEPSEESSVEPGDESIDQPSEDSVYDPSDDSSDEPSDDSSDGPSDESSVESSASDEKAHEPKRKKRKPASSSSVARPAKEVQQTSYGRVPKLMPALFPNEKCGGEDIDPTFPEDVNRVFFPEGSYDIAPGVRAALLNRNKYQREVVERDHTHFAECAVCGLAVPDGDESAVRCAFCPRSFHRRCLVGHPSSAGRCAGCERDSSMGTEEDIVRTAGVTIDGRIARAYLRYGGEPDHETVCRMLSDALAIVEKLIVYNFGSVLSVEVDTVGIPDYLKIVRRPMDYGTITRNLINGQYTPQETQEGPGTTNGTAAPTIMSPLESVLLQVMSDVEQVHHNCSLYNRKGSNYGRAGEIHGRKWRAYLDRHLSGRLPPAVASALRRRRAALDDESRGSFSISLQAARQGSRMTVAVLDPDAKVIVKQYSSQNSATKAAMLLHRLGYECEAPIGSDHAGRARIKAAADPGSLLFGYQWIPLDHLKSGKFRVKSESLVPVKLEQRYEYETEEESDEEECIQRSGQRAAGMAYGAFSASPTGSGEGRGRDCAETRTGEDAKAALKGSARCVLDFERAAKQDDGPLLPVNETVGGDAGAPCPKDGDNGPEAEKEREGGTPGVPMEVAANAVDPADPPGDQADHEDGSTLTNFPDNEDCVDGGGGHSDRPKEVPLGEDVIEQGGDAPAVAPPSGMRAECDESEGGESDRTRPYDSDVRDRDGGGDDAAALDIEALPREVTSSLSGRGGFSASDGYSDEDDVAFHDEVDYEYSGVPSDWRAPLPASGLSTNPRPAQKGDDSASQALSQRLEQDDVVDLIVSRESNDEDEVGNAVPEADATKQDDSLQPPVNETVGGDAGVPCPEDGDIEVEKGRKGEALDLKKPHAGGFSEGSVAASESIDPVNLPADEAGDEDGSQLTNFPACLPGRIWNVGNLKSACATYRKSSKLNGWVEQSIPRKRENIIGCLKKEHIYYLSPRGDRFRQLAKAQHAEAKFAESSRHAASLATGDESPGSDDDAEMEDASAAATAGGLAVVGESGDAAALVSSDKDNKNPDGEEKKKPTKAKGKASKSNNSGYLPDVEAIEEEQPVSSIDPGYEAEASEVEAAGVIRSRRNLRVQEQKCTETVFEQGAPSSAVREGPPPLPVMEEAGSASATAQGKMAVVLAVHTSPPAHALGGSTLLTSQMKKQGTRDRANPRTEDGLKVVSEGFGDDASPDLEAILKSPAKHDDGQQLPANEIVASSKAPSADKVFSELEYAPEFRRKSGAEEGDVQSTESKKGGNNNMEDTAVPFMEPDERPTKRGGVAKVRGGMRTIKRTADYGNNYYDSLVKRQPRSRGSQTIVNDDGRDGGSKHTSSLSFSLFAFNNDPSFSIASTGSRPKRKLKLSISRYGSVAITPSIRVGHGFNCPLCRAECTYNTKQCLGCGAEVSYEAGVGVTILKDRDQVSMANKRGVARRAPSAKASAGAASSTATSADKVVSEVERAPILKALRRKEAGSEEVGVKAGDDSTDRQGAEVGLGSTLTSIPGNKDRHREEGGGGHSDGTREAPSGEDVIEQGGDAPAVAPPSGAHAELDESEGGESDRTRQYDSDVHDRGDGNDDAAAFDIDALAREVASFHGGRGDFSASDEQTQRKKESRGSSKGGATGGDDAVTSKDLIDYKDDCAPPQAAGSIVVTTATVPPTSSIENHQAESIDEDELGIAVPEADATKQSDGPLLPLNKTVGGDAGAPCHEGGDICPEAEREREGEALDVKPHAGGVSKGQVVDKSNNEDGSQLTNPASLSVFCNVRRKSTKVPWEVAANAVDPADPPTNKDDDEDGSTLTNSPGDEDRRRVKGGRGHSDGRFLPTDDEGHEADNDPCRALLSPGMKEAVATPQINDGHKQKVTMTEEENVGAVVEKNAIAVAPSTAEDDSYYAYGNTDAVEATATSPKLSEAITTATVLKRGRHEVSGIATRMEDDGDGRSNELSIADDGAPPAAAETLPVGGDGGMPAPAPLPEADAPEKMASLLAVQTVDGTAMEAGGGTEEARPTSAPAREKMAVVLAVFTSPPARAPGGQWIEQVTRDCADPGTGGGLKVASRGLGDGPGPDLAKQDGSQLPANEIVGRDAPEAARERTGQTDEALETKPSAGEATKDGEAVAEAADPANPPTDGADNGDGSTLTNFPACMPGDWNVGKSKRTPTYRRSAELSGWVEQFIPRTADKNGKVKYDKHYLCSDGGRFQSLADAQKHAASLEAGVDPAGPGNVGDRSATLGTEAAGTASSARGRKSRSLREPALDEHQATAARAGATPDSKLSADILPTRRSKRKEKISAAAATQEGDTPISALTAAEEDGPEGDEDGLLIVRSAGGKDEDSHGSSYGIPKSIVAVKKGSGAAALLASVPEGRTLDNDNVIDDCDCSGTGATNVGTIDLTVKEYKSPDVDQSVVGSISLHTSVKCKAPTKVGANARAQSDKAQIAGAASSKAPSADKVFSELEYAPELRRNEAGAEEGDIQSTESHKEDIVVPFMEPGERPAKRGSVGTTGGKDAAMSSCEAATGDSDVDDADKETEPKVDTVKIESLVKVETDEEYYEYDNQEGDDLAKKGRPQRPQQDDVVDLLDSSSDEEGDEPSKRERREEGPGGVAAEVDGGYKTADEEGGNADFVPMSRKAAASAESPPPRASQHAAEDANGVYSSENNADADDEHTLNETEESEASHVEAPFDEKEEDDPDLDCQAADPAIPAAGSPPPDHKRPDHQQENVLFAAAMSQQLFKEDDRALSQAQQPPASAFPAPRSSESSDEDASAAATAGGTAVGEDGDGFCRAKLSIKDQGRAIASTLVSPEDLTDGELQGNGNFNSKAETVLNRVARDRELLLSRQHPSRSTSLKSANLSDSKAKKDSRPSSEDEDEGGDSEQSLNKHRGKTNAVVENIKTGVQHGLSLRSIFAHSNPIDTSAAKSTSQLSNIAGSRPRLKEAPKPNEKAGNRKDEVPDDSDGKQSSFETCDKHENQAVTTDQPGMDRRPAAKDNYTDKVSPFHSEPDRKRLWKSKKANANSRPTRTNVPAGIDSDIIGTDPNSPDRIDERACTKTADIKDAVFKCPTCDKAFTSMSSLKKHHGGAHRSKVGESKVREGQGRLREDIDARSSKRQKVFSTNLRRNMERLRALSQRPGVDQLLVASFNLDSVVKFGKKRNALCMSKGCTKYAQSQCDGLCNTHYNILSNGKCTPTQTVRLDEPFQLQSSFWLLPKTAGLEERTRLPALPGQAIRRSRRQCALRDDHARSSNEGGVTSSGTAVPEDLMDCEDHDATTRLGAQDREDCASPENRDEAAGGSEEVGAAVSGKDNYTDGVSPFHYEPDRKFFRERKEANTPMDEGHLTENDLSRALLSPGMKEAVAAPPIDKGHEPEVTMTKEEKDGGAGAEKNTTAVAPKNASTAEDDSYYTDENTEAGEATEEEQPPDSGGATSPNMSPRSTALSEDTVVIMTINGEVSEGYIAEEERNNSGAGQATAGSGVEEQSLLRSAVGNVLVTTTTVLKRGRHEAGGIETRMDDGEEDGRSNELSIADNEAPPAAAEARPVGGEDRMPPHEPLPEADASQKMVALLAVKTLDGTAMEADGGTEESRPREETAGGSKGRETALLDADAAIEEAGSPKKFAALLADQTVSEVAQGKMAVVLAVHTSPPVRALGGSTSLTSPMIEQGTRDRTNPRTEDGLKVVSEGFGDDPGPDLEAELKQPAKLDNGPPLPTNNENDKTPDSSKEQNASGGSKPVRGAAWEREQSARDGKETRPTAPAKTAGPRTLHGRGSPIRRLINKANGRRPPSKGDTAPATHAQPSSGTAAASANQGTSGRGKKRRSKSQVVSKKTSKILRR